MADSPAGKLSGGQRKRLNVAVELLARPRVLFLDEPTSGLDPATETRLMRVLENLAGRGTTVVCSTHVMENLGLFGQVVVVAGGTVRYSGPPQFLLSHFGVKDFPALYERLEDLPAAPVAAPVGGSHVGAAPAPKPVTSGQGVRRLGSLLARGFRIIARDRHLSLLLLAQPVVIGVLINLSQVRPDVGMEALLFAIVAAIWFGLSNTAREVVRDRPVCARERFLGVGPLTYLASNSTLFGAIGAVQVLILVLVIRFAHFLPAQLADEVWKAQPLWHLAAVLWTTYLAAMFLGLTVSSFFHTEEAAVAVLPLLLLPQLLLTGIASRLDSDQDGSFRSLIVWQQKASARTGFPARWTALEVVSLATLSRPAMVLLQKVPPKLARRATVFNWLHQAMMVLVTLTALLIVFHRTDRKWLERL